MSSIKHVMERVEKFWTKCHESITMEEDKDFLTPTIKIRKSGRRVRPVDKGKGESQERPRKHA